MIDNAVLENDSAVLENDNGMLENGRKKLENCNPPSTFFFYFSQLDILKNSCEMTKHRVYHYELCAVRK